MRLFARCLAGLVASLQLAAVALLAILAFSGDSHGAARSLAIVTAVPLLAITVPALYLAFRSHRSWLAIGLAVVSALVSIVTA